jgi:hypothetical protein
MKGQSRGRQGKGAGRRSRRKLFRFSFFLLLTVGLLLPVF